VTQLTGADAMMSCGRVQLSSADGAVWCGGHDDVCMTSVMVENIYFEFGNLHVTREIPPPLRASMGRGVLRYISIQSTS
jgi:hypothetical protein